MIVTSDTDGIEINWGNKDAILALIEKIGKREGIGYLLGEGVKRASEQIGGEADRYAIHVKGLELPGYEPRAVKGYGLSMAVSNIGGSHMYGRPKAEMAGEVDSLTEEGKGASIVQAQKEQAIEDSLIACSFGNSGLDFQKYSEFLLAATGIKEFADVAHLMEVGERIICLERCFNIREGFRRKDDTLPRRMFSEPLRRGGPAENQTFEKLDKLLDEYYEAAGYTREGIPTVKKLKDLGIEEMVSIVNGGGALRK
jgi:aldehyde:ferredoxin oxidoreductase